MPIELLVKNATGLPDNIEGIKHLPQIHNDPFDRLIIAQAICENYILITMDQTIPKYAVETLW